MSEPTDHELLADYARTGAEPAFAQLVARYINLVHSAARRHAGSEEPAGEITQAVFLILARKAGSLAKGGPRRHAALSGWLYQTARLTAANALKAETRRQLRDHEAYMQTQENQADAAVWREIAPLLDDAIGKLGETDRAVLVLRFFEGRTNAETAAALGLAEGAVQKRVLRALEKLRASFAKQGVTHTAQAIAGTVTTNAVQVAPAGLLLKVSLLGSKGALVTTSITALVNGTLKTIAMTTIQKTLITATLIASVGVGIYEAKEIVQARAEVRTLHQQQAPLAEQIRQLQMERDKATNQIAWLNDQLAKNEKNNLELLKLRGDISNLRNQTKQLTESKSSDYTDPTIAAALEWAKRVKTLKERFLQWPGKKTLEIQMLTEQEWLNEAAARKLDSEDDCRQAMSKLRMEAKNKFSTEVNKAMKLFAEKNNNQLPSDPSELEPYLGPPANLCLADWQIAKSGWVYPPQPNSPDSANAETWALVEKGSFTSDGKAIRDGSYVADPEYDMTVVIYQGGCYSYGPDKKSK